MLILEGQKDIYMPVRQLADPGPQASVYICENQKGKQFAGKIYNDVSGLSPLVLRFLGQTRCPNYLRLVDLGTTIYKGQKRAFELYEYIPADNMSKAVPYEPEFLEKVVIPGLNEALHTLHEAGFLHRDVKSDNLYLRKTADGDYQLALGDFGICVPMDESKTYCDGGMAFTPGYVPAEVLGSGTYSPASDYYAMAVTIYYLLTGKQIFDGMKPDEIMVRTRRGEMASFDKLPGRFATLLEGLTVQDPRYRFGYREVCAWLEGADLPVFHYVGQGQVLDPPYQLTAKVSCVSLQELAENLKLYPEEGKKHLYEGLLGDRFRKEYQHLATVLTDITVRRFPHRKNAGLTACIRLLDPEMDGFYFDGRSYSGIDELIDRVARELAGGVLSASMEELLTSQILTYYYQDLIGKAECDKIREVEKLAATNVMKAASRFVLNLAQTPFYQVGKEKRIYSIEEYIDYLGNCPDNVEEQIYRDFNKEYFEQWMEKIGFSVAFREWRSYFYKGEHVLADEQIVGNACQFLERICPDGAATLRAFVFREIERSPEYWLLGNYALYDMDDMMVQMVQDNFETVICDESMEIPELMRKRHEMKEYMNELRRDFLNNPYLYELGIYDALEYRIYSKYPDAYFVMNRNYELVPIGWMREFGDLQTRMHIEKGCEALSVQAAESILAAEKKVNDMAEDVKDTCEDLIRKKKVPGLSGGIFMLLVSLCALFFWGRFYGQFHVKSSLFTLAGYALSFFAAAVGFCAAIYRMELYGLFRILKKEEVKLKSIADSIKASLSQLEGKGKKPFEKELSLAEENLEMKACEEYAKANYLGKVKNLKNGLLRHGLLILASWVFLLGGLYMDKKIELDADFWQKEIRLLLSPVKFHNTPGHSADDKSEICKVSVSAARLREGPGTDFEVLNTYSKGTELELTGAKQSDGEAIWYQVLTEDGLVGWMRSDTIQ